MNRIMISLFCLGMILSVAPVSASPESPADHFSLRLGQDTPHRALNITLEEPVALATAADDDPFEQGDWIWTMYGGGSWGDEAGDVYTLRLGVGYHLLDNVSFNFEAVGAFADGDPSNVNLGAQTRDAAGGGLDFIIRWHWLRQEQFSLYIDGGCGFIVFDKEWPGHGTNFNFTPQIGMGFTFELSDRLMLMAGARWYHISNARIKGYNNNVGYDAGMAYIGLMWPF